MTATGFKKYQAKGVKLDVAEKARVDVTLQVGAATTEVIVEGENVAQVETQSSELAGTVTGKEITQLELNGRNFTTLVTLVPGVSNQTGMDEAAGRHQRQRRLQHERRPHRVQQLGTRWRRQHGQRQQRHVERLSQHRCDCRIQGADFELRRAVRPQRFRHGRSRNQGRNEGISTATPTSSCATTLSTRRTISTACLGRQRQAPPYKKNDFGYTIGGPVYIPGVYNKDKQKTFFFWSQEWRRERVPGQLQPRRALQRGTRPAISATVPEPAIAQRILLQIARSIHSNRVAFFNRKLRPAAGRSCGDAHLLPLIPVGTSDVPGASVYNTNTTLPTSWREELVRVDHNINDHNRVTFRYIHDSWNTVEPGPIWDSASFPTVQTAFNGPGVSMVARLTSTISPTLLNEFVASYTTDHISFKSVGALAAAVRLLPDGIHLQQRLWRQIAGHHISWWRNAYDGGFAEDPDGIWPEGPYNSNPTYTYRDNMTKIIGRHNLQFGAYFVAAQKNELSSVQVNGSLDVSTPSLSGQHRQCLRRHAAGATSPASARAATS